MIDLVQEQDDVIDLKIFFTILFDNRLIIASITSIFAVLSILLSLSLQNIYLSQSLLIPSSKEDSLSSKLGNLSSLSTLAGVPLPNSTTTKSQEGIERIKSFEFFKNYFLPQVKLENILAVKKWIPDENIIIYKDNIYDEGEKKWLKQKPSEQEAYKTYRKILSVTQDKKTSFTTVSIEHHSPIIAQKWVNIIINSINKSMREIDASQAEKSIAYLNEISISTTIQPIKDAIARLLENQMQILMLTESNDAYVFKVIDPPIASEEKFKPFRAIICIIGLLFGIFISLIIVFTRYLLAKYK